MIEGKHIVKQNIVRRLHERDRELIVHDSNKALRDEESGPEQLLLHQQQPPLQSSKSSGAAAAAVSVTGGCSKKPSAYNKRLLGNRKLTKCDWISLSLTCLTSLLIGVGFYLALFHGLFPDSGTSSPTTAKAGMYIMCAGIGVLLLHLLICFAQVAAHSKPSRRELEKFTEFSRRCKMLSSVPEVETVPPASAGADAAGQMMGAEVVEDRQRRRQQAEAEDQDDAALIARLSKSGPR